MTTQVLNIRRATADDLPEVIDVCGAALQWSGDDADAEFFAWKHFQNPFGTSPIWVAEEETADGRKIVGVRTMMLWRFAKADGSTLRMARAVDTATLPSHQGKGIFSKLTMAAVEELTAEGYDAIFNTPNDKSRPGYLKMGWESMGRVRVTVRPRSLPALISMGRNKVAAERWGIQTDVGLDPAHAFADTEKLNTVLETAAHDGGSSDRWATPLSSDYLRWRTDFGPLNCRVMPLGGDIGDGFIVFRIRRRGDLNQLSVLHVATTSSSRSVRGAVNRLISASGADLVMASGQHLGPVDAMIPVPNIGPIMTWRALARTSPVAMDQMTLPLGVIELF